MDGKPIICPNGHDERQWTALSREAQIHWWLLNGSPQNAERNERAKKHVRRALRYYRKGIVTKHEAVNDIADFFDEQSLREYLPQMPEEIRVDVLERARQSPPIEDEKAWASGEVYFVGLYDQSTTEEDFERMTWEARSNSYHFARIMRVILGSEAGPGREENPETSPPQKLSIAECHKSSVPISED